MPLRLNQKRLAALAVISTAMLTISSSPARAIDLVFKFGTAQPEFDPLLFTSPSPGKPWHPTSGNPREKILPNVYLSNDYPVSQETINLVSTYPQIEQLKIDGDLREIDLSPLRSLPKLRSLDLSLAKVNAKVLSTTAQLPTVDQLVVTPENAGDLAALAPMTRLKYLHASSWGLPSHQPLDAKFLDRMVSLEELKLNHYVNTDGVAHIVRLPKLRTLFVSVTEDDAVPVLSKATLLARLSLPGSNIHGANFSALKDLPLTYLNLNGCPLTADCIDELLTLNSLQNLDVSETPLQDEDLIKLSTSPNLQHVSMLYMKCATPYAAKELSERDSHCGTYGLRRYDDGSAVNPGLAIRTGFESSGGFHTAPVPISMQKAQREEQLRNTLHAIIKNGEYLRLPSLELDLVDFYVKTDRLYEAELLSRQILETLPTLRKSTELAASCLSCNGSAEGKYMTSFWRNIEINARLQLLEILVRRGRTQECALVLPPIETEHCPQTYPVALNQARYQAVSDIVYRKPTAHIAIDKLLALVDYVQYHSPRPSAAEVELIALAYLASGDLERARHFEQEAIDHPLYGLECYRRRWMNHSLIANLLRDTGTQPPVDLSDLEPTVGQELSYSTPLLKELETTAFIKLQSPWWHTQPLIARQSWISEYNCK